MIYVICNPTAGNGRGKKAGKKIGQMLEEKNIEHEMRWTEKPGHASVLAREASALGANTVLSVGGDGTSFETAQGLAGANTALGVIPAGTGNDFVKALGSPLSIEAALEFILAHPAKKTDVGEINGRMFLNEIGTGFDVSVLDYAEKAKRYVRGLLPYLHGVAQTLFRFHSIPITYSIDGGPLVTKDAFVAAVANGGMIGGGIPIAPEARVDDGLFDVVIVGAIEKKKLLSRLLGLMQGKILTFPETVFVRAASVEFSAPNMRVNIDGEIVTESRASARVLPGALWVHRK